MLAYFVPDLAILSPEKQKRIAFADHHVFNFSNEDGVVARLLR